MHRMIISREKISDDKIELLLSQLKLNDDTILISEYQLNALREDVKEEFNDEHNIRIKEYYQIIMKCIEEIEKQPCEKYYKINEALIYDSKNICANKRTLGYIVSLLRKYTDNKYYNKLSDTVHEICSMLAKMD